MRPNANLAVLALAALIAAPAHAADQTILGTFLKVKNPSTATKRSVSVKGKEKASSNTIVGNPVLNGATLTITATGASSSQQAFPLPSSGWSGDYSRGYKYKDPKGVNGPVKTARLRKTGSGNFLVNATISAKVQPVTVLPPNPGTSGCALLEISGGDSYSVQFTGGTITNKDTREYSHKKVTTEGSCAPTCSDGVQNQGESDIDCGGANCAACPAGDSCVVAADCQSGVCTLGVCVATCFDGAQNNDETDIDCGGSCAADCAFNKGCALDNDCVTTHCSGGLCKCANQLYTFTINSNVGGAFDSAEWPGGGSSQSAAPSCGVTINRPSGNIDLVGTLGDAFSVNSAGNYSSCVGSGGEDGDGCNPLSCPPLGIGSCQDGRPSCSAALNGSGSAQYFVQCLE